MLRKLVSFLALKLALVQLSKTLKIVSRVLFLSLKGEPPFKSV